MPTTITINPKTNLKGEDAKCFFNFLTAQKELGVSYFKPKSTFNFEENTIYFQSGFLCENGLDGSYKGNIVGREIGQGAFAVVHQIEQAVQVTGLEFIPSGYTQPRVIKIQQHCACPSARKQCAGQKHHSLQSFHKEVDISRQIPHLHFGSPVIESTHSYVTMNEVPGQELFHIIGADIQTSNRLTLQQRFALSLEILQAVISQVKKCGVIHRDLKPENIKVVLEPPMQVNIFDYGLAIKFSDDQRQMMKIEKCGSLVYMAPEVMLLDKHDTASPAQDVFSVARVLYLIWGGLDNSYIVDIESKDYLMHADRDYLTTLSSLFQSIPLNQANVLRRLELDDKIKLLFKKMQAFKSEHRITIEQAFDEFTTMQGVFHRYQQDAVNVMAKPVSAGDPRFFATTEQAVKSAPPKSPVHVIQHHTAAESRFETTV